MLSQPGLPSFFRVLPLMLVLLATMLIACARSTPTPEQTPAQPHQLSLADTLRGTIAVVGTDPTAVVSLRTTISDPLLFLAGDEIPALRRLHGIDTWIAGRRTGENTFHVLAFEVRAVDGLPAVDGILTAEPAGLSLLTADGQKLLVQQPPPALRELAGARIWVAGPLHLPPAAWGLIQNVPGTR